MLKLVKPCQLIGLCGEWLGVKRGIHAGIYCKRERTFCGDWLAIPNTAVPD